MNKSASAPNASSPNGDAKNAQPKSSPVAASVGRIEFFARRLLERIGGAIDFSLRRGVASPRTDLAALVQHLERAIEANLRQQADGLVAPHLLELRYDYETFRSLSQAQREHLERSLSQNLHEYIHNRRYRTLGEVKASIAYDAFTRGLQVNATFGDRPVAATQQQAASRGQQPQQISAPPAAKVTVCDLTLRVLLTRAEQQVRVASNAEPVGIGRNAANAIVLKDPSVSSFHAALLIEPDGALAVADRTSSNGTYVNGTLIESGGRCQVRDGDHVRFGEIETIISFQ